jgi:hypothetical protein
MVTKTQVVVPIDTDQYSIVIPEPCTCCGQPVDPNLKYWRINLKYPLKQWGKGEKFDNWETQNIKDEQGMDKMARIAIQAAYCPKHLKAPDTIKKTRKWAVIVSSALAIVAFIALVILVEFPGWPAVIRDQEGLEYLLVIFGLPIFVFCGAKFLFHYLGQWVMKRLNPELGDYSYETTGHWGLDFLLITHAGEKGIGPITYSCEISFTNPDSAERFKKSLQTQSS